MDNIPHLALPLRVVGNSYVSLQQDTADELATTVAVVVGFPLGYRVERPDFGITDPALRQRPLDTGEIEAQCATYEPRAQLIFTEAPLDPADPLATQLRIQVAQAPED